MLTDSVKLPLKSLKQNGNATLSGYLPSGQGRWQIESLLGKPHLQFAEQNQCDLLHAKDDLYTADVEIGDPPQILSLLVDTGSPYTWVTSVDCENCGQKKKFDPKKSQTVMPYNMKVTLRYASGECTGTMFYDTVRSFKIPGLWSLLIF